MKLNTPIVSGLLILSSKYLTEFFKPEKIKIKNINKIDFLYWNSAPVSFIILKIKNPTKNTKIIPNLNIKVVNMAKVIILSDLSHNNINNTLMKLNNDIWGNPSLFIIKLYL